MHPIPSNLGAISRGPAAYWFKGHFGVQSLTSVWQPSRSSVIYYGKSKAWPTHKSSVRERNAANPTLVLCPPGKIINLRIQVARAFFTFAPFLECVTVRRPTLNILAWVWITFKQQMHTCPCNRGVFVFAIGHPSFPDISRGFPFSRQWNFQGSFILHKTKSMG